MRPQSSTISVRIVLMWHSFSPYSGQGCWSKSKVSYCACRLWPSRRRKLHWQTQTGTTICNRGATPTSLGCGRRVHLSSYVYSLPCSPHSSVHQGLTSIPRPCQAFSHILTSFSVGALRPHRRI